MVYLSLTSCCFYDLCSIRQLNLSQKYMRERSIKTYNENLEKALLPLPSSFPTTFQIFIKHHKNFITLLITLYFQKEVSDNIKPVKKQVSINFKVGIPMSISYNHATKSETDCDECTCDRYFIRRAFMHF